MNLEREGLWSLTETFADAMGIEIAHKVALELQWKE
jgi:hypothetical protein